LTTVNARIVDTVVQQEPRFPFSACSRHRHQSKTLNRSFLCIFEAVSKCPLQKLDTSQHAHGYPICSTSCISQVREPQSLLEPPTERHFTRSIADPGPLCGHAYTMYQCFGILESRHVTNRCTCNCFCRKEIVANHNFRPLPTPSLARPSFPNISYPAWLRRHSPRQQS